MLSMLLQGQVTSADASGAQGAGGDDAVRNSSLAVSADTSCAPHHP